MALHLVKSRSHYDRLLLGDFEGTDVVLMFEEEEDKEEEEGAAANSGTVAEEGAAAASAGAVDHDRREALLSSSALGIVGNDDEEDEEKGPAATTGTVAEEVEGNDGGGTVAAAGTVDDGRGARLSTTQQRRRIIPAHRIIVQTCGLIRAAMESLESEESSSPPANTTKQVVAIFIPRGTLESVDSLLRWCYDCHCYFPAIEKRTEFFVLESRVVGIPPLWILANHVQEKELCRTIDNFMRNGMLRSGLSFAGFVEEAVAMNAMSLIKVALEGVPLDPTRREELEDWLDHGASELLAALCRCHQLFENIKSSPVEEEDKDETMVTLDETTLNSILDVVGERLFEMSDDERHTMPPLLFARCLARFPPGSNILESDYADMVLKYIESSQKSDSMHGRLPESSIRALLSSVDFGAINRKVIGRQLISRVELLSPRSALEIIEWRCDHATKIHKREIEELPVGVDPPENVEPTTRDVLFGKGRPHPGNMRLLFILETLLPEFEELNKVQKNHYIAKLVREQKEHGVKFLTPRYGYWSETSDKEAHHKVANMVRNVRKRLVREKVIPPRPKPDKKLPPEKKTTGQKSEEMNGNFLQGYYNLLQGRNENAVQGNYNLIQDGCNKKQRFSS